jgi:hypothetical protein
MDMVKAICECKDMSESDLVVAVKRERFHFVEEWGILTWIMVVILTLLTGGFWLLFIAGYHFEDILNPKYYCSQCGAIIGPQQFRL